ncbi:hypothetical protein PAXRUDRAFT_833350 [Paxillus rubicundulus Ve08.2h10]|uniref:Uncharacterized protein n=1 Tax=Paxillus rubicundulus Ve08.2h10 TaxID=930991 RepID=A0A0D0DH67_9AGAM|nr:hypothetical protein PAXRUDRAFT_833350 [Paxillus rubicundulus Ve08.2h10]
MTTTLMHACRMHCTPYYDGHASRCMRRDSPRMSPESSSPSLASTYSELLCAQPQ